MSSANVKCWVGDPTTGVYTVDTKITTLEDCFSKHIIERENLKCQNCVLYTPVDSKDPPTLPTGGVSANWMGCSYTNEHGSVCKE